MKSKKTSRAASRPRRRNGASEYAAFTVVLEDLRAQFAVFGEALQEKASRGELHAVRDELRNEMHEMRNELRLGMHDLRTAILDLSRKMPA